MKLDESWVQSTPTTCWTVSLKHSASANNENFEAIGMILTGKRALITGGTKGIGAAIAVDLARAGCDVAINGRHDDASAAAVRQAIATTGRKCESITADVARPDDIDRLVREAEAGLGGLDILVH